MLIIFAIAFVALIVTIAGAGMLGAHAGVDLAFGDWLSAVFYFGASLAWAVGGGGTVAALTWWGLQ